MFDWRCMDCSHIFLRDPSYLKLRAQEAIHRTNSSYFEALWPWFSAFSLAGWGWREPWCATALVLWWWSRWSWPTLVKQAFPWDSSWRAWIVQWLGTVIGQAVQQVLVAWITRWRKPASLAEWGHRSWGHCFFWGQFLTCLDLLPYFCWPFFFLGAINHHKPRK